MRCLRPTPRLRFASYEELNAWLLDRCLEHAEAHRHPELRDRTIADVFEDEKPALMRMPTTPFDGFHAVAASVSKTLLVRFDYNKYSVAARALGRPVEVHGYAYRIVIRQGDDIVVEHDRRFGREQTAYDPWHYVPVLAKKPGALRNGAPFKQLVLPPALERLRGKLKGSDDVVLNILARPRSAPMEPSIATPEHLQLKIEPAADAGRYDQLLPVQRAA